jgi:hypothetical protein
MALLSSFVGLISTQGLVNSGLLVNLDANKYSGSGATWNDESGNNRNATITGALSYTSGNDAYFSGFGDATYISLSNSGLVPRNNDFTDSVWVYFNSVDSLDTIFENGSWTDTLLFRFETNLFTVHSEGLLRGTLNWTATTGSWVNLVLIRESNTVSLYVNNVLTGTPFTMNLDINLANPNLFLMRSQHATGQQTNGRLGMFAVYDKALSSDERSSNYNNIKGRYGL